MVQQKIKGGFSTSTASVATHSLSNPLATCSSAPCLMHKEFGAAPFFSPLLVACSSSLQPENGVSYKLLTASSGGVGVLLEAESSIQGGRTDFVKNYSMVDK
jgi:hypothetical protein